MKQAKILVTKEVIRVERTKGLTGSIYRVSQKKLTPLLFI